MDKIFENPIIMALLKMSLIIYGSRLSPKLPIQVNSWFDNTFVKILGIALIIWTASKDFQLALLIAIVFVFSVNLLSGRSAIESFAEYSNNYTIYNKQQLIEQKTQIYPGCLNITMADLLNTFNNDQLKLQDTVHTSYKELIKSLPVNSTEMSSLKSIAKAVGLPYNVSYIDENAPLIATLLIMQGFKINDTCQVPSGNIQNPNIVFPIDSIYPNNEVSPDDNGDFASYI